ncbi:MAG: thioredoxin domain-containing protein [Bacteroidetes bacterium]|nr:thioredoxin domain-containing protein [Bacteroidota bacterium]
MAQTFNSNLKKVALAYARLLNIPVTKSSLQTAIEENPYYPSLLSLSDTLDRYNIPNAAYNVPAEEIDQLQAPFIAYMSIPGVGSDFALVTRISGDTVDLIYDRNKAQTIEKAQFYQRFKRVALVAGPDENSGEKNYKANRRKELAENNKRYLLASAAILTLLFIAVSNGITADALAYVPITAIKLAGLATATLLLAYETDKTNAFVKNICTAGAKTNCDAILGSKASKLWGISWSEIGFFYFASTALILLMSGLSFSYKTGCLAILNAFAAPYILFSIYYQWRVAKQWCPLCLTIQAALAAELVWSIFTFWLPVHSFSFLAAGGITSLFEIAFALLLPLTGWYALKPYLFKAKDHDLYKNAYKRLQYNPDIFNGLLIQQAKAADNWQQLGITIGNPDAPNTIIKVCNPYCGPCAKAHPKLEDIIKNNKNINVRVIFTAKNNEHDRGAPIVKHLLAVAAQNDRARTQQALDDWYLAPKKDYELFSAKYPMNGELKQQDDKVEAMSEWCIEAEITHTPTIFVNGYLLPQSYDIEALMYILK